MKIAYLSTFYPFRGGIAQFNAAMYREFEKNHEINAYTFTRQYPNLLFPGTSQYVTDSDNADKINSTQILDTINPLSYYKSAEIINSFEPDLLLTKFWIPFFAPSLGKVARKLSKKTCKMAVLDNVIPHEKRPFDIQLIKYFLESYDKFIVMSQEVEKDLLSLKPNAKYIYHEHPIYNHFDEKIEMSKAREMLGIPVNKKVLLFFGFIRDYKGLDILIDALSLLDSDYVLIIAGEVYGNFEKYQEQINRLNLQHRIILNVRYISDQEVPVFFSAADVCVLPYRSATQSGITAISYNFNLPVIATDVGGLKEIIQERNTGIIVPNAEAEYISEAINKYFVEDKIQFYSSNIQKYKDEASWIHLVNEIEKFVS